MVLSNLIYNVKSRFYQFVRQHTRPKSADEIQYKALLFSRIYMIAALTAAVAAAYNFNKGIFKKSENASLPYHEVIIKNLDLKKKVRVIMMDGFNCTDDFYVDGAKIIEKSKVKSHQNENTVT